jgi:hypothetical protein
MAIITFLYILVLPFLSKRYTAKWNYMVWLVIAAGWLFPCGAACTIISGNPHVWHFNGTDIGDFISYDENSTSGSVRSKHHRDIFCCSRSSNSISSAKYVNVVCDLSGRPFCL